MRIPISTKFFELRRGTVIQLITLDIRHRILIQNNKNIAKMLTYTR